MLALLALVTAVASTPEWAMTGHDFMHTGRSDLPGPSGPTPQPHWSYNAADELNGSPAVQGAVFIASNDGNLYSLDATTGAPLWKFDTADSVESSPALFDGTVVFGSRCVPLMWAVGRRRTPRCGASAAAVAVA
jgi:hypothetical protein